MISEEITSMELDFLLRFPVKPHVTSPVDFISNYAWGGICSLAAKEEFRNLDRDIENQAKRWKKIIESECPEKEKFPQEWKNKTALQRLCMMRALRPDRMCYALTYADCLFIDAHRKIYYMYIIFFTAISLKKSWAQNMSRIALWSSPNHLKKLARVHQYSSSFLLA